MNIPKIEKTALDFRDAIERCSKSLGISFEQFPLGSCGDTVPLLGAYLTELDLGEFMYMEGHLGKPENGTWRSHAWLQHKELVVDITADQFPEIDQKVIVAVNSEWHQSLNGESMNVANFRNYDERTVNSLESMYKKIIYNIKKT